MMANIFIIMFLLFLCNTAIHNGTYVKQSNSDGKELTNWPSKNNANAVDLVHRL